MAISNPPSFSSVRTEFNNAGMGIASNLFAYRRGGGIVPDVSYYSAIGTGGAGSPVRLSQFAGLEGSSVATLANHYADVYHASYGSDFYNSSSAFSRLTVNSNGQLTMLGSTSWSSAVSNDGIIDINGTNYWADGLAGSSSGEVAVQNWLNGGGASLYSCRAVINTALSDNPNGVTTFRNGTYETWLALTSSREFSVSASTASSTPGGTISLVFTLQIARTTDLNTILGSCSIRLSADSLSSSGEIER